MSAGAHWPEADDQKTPEGRRVRASDGHERLDDLCTVSAGASCDGETPKDGKSSKRCNIKHMY